MIERETEIVNRLGLHARAAAKLVHTAGGFQSRVTVVKDGEEVDAKSILGHPAAGGGAGDARSPCAATGKDEEAAMEAVTELIAEPVRRGELSMGAEMQVLQRHGRLGRDRHRPRRRASRPGGRRLPHPARPRPGRGRGRAPVRGRPPRPRTSCSAPATRPARTSATSWRRSSTPTSCCSPTAASSARSWSASATTRSTPSGRCTKTAEELDERFAHIDDSLSPRAQRGPDRRQPAPAAQPAGDLPPRALGAAATTWSSWPTT